MIALLVAMEIHFESGSDSFVELMNSFKKPLPVNNVIRISEV